MATDRGWAMAMTPNRSPRARAVEHARLVDAEHGPRGGLAADGQARIGVAGDHEGIDVVALSTSAGERQGDALHVRLGFDAAGSLLEGAAFDLGPVLRRRPVPARPRALGHDLVGIRVHDQNAAAGARGHAGILIDLPPLLGPPRATSSAKAANASKGVSSDATSRFRLRDPRRPRRHGRRRL